MPPQIGKSDYSGEVREEGQGGFFSKIPLWVWIAAGAVLLYALWTKFQNNSGSSSNPLVTSSPTDTTPYGNLSAALSEILGNQQAITAQLQAQQQGINTPAGVNVPSGSVGSTYTSQPNTATSMASQAVTGAPGSGPTYDKVVTGGSNPNAIYRLPASSSPGTTPVTKQVPALSWNGIPLQGPWAPTKTVTQQVPLPIVPSTTRRQGGISAQRTL